MTNVTVPFDRYIHNALFPLRWTFAIVASFLISAMFSLYALSIRAQSDQQLINSISPYLATLVESSDRPEALRVLESISENRGVEVVLVLDGIAFASTRSISEMDRPFVPPSDAIKFRGSQLSTSSIISTAVVRREGAAETNARIVMLNPLRPVLVEALILFTSMFFVSLTISILWTRRTQGAIKKALRPLTQLHEEIRSLTSDAHPATSSIQIRELEEIRRALRKSKGELENAKDRLAEERAKKLSAEAYKGLIHDLHNPVAAMKQMVRIAFGRETDEEAKSEALESLPRIADQIVNQVSAGRMNLENQIQSFRECDLRSCIQDSVAIVNGARDSSDGKRIEISLPSEPVVAAHDPVLLQRALVNLIENGLGACQRLVHISLDSLSGYPSILVSDDGNGLNESLLPIFLQGRGRSSKDDRPAMGLASVSHIVKSHGGKIIYKMSALGGAGFEIRLGGGL